MRTATKHKGRTGPFSCHVTKNRVRERRNGLTLTANDGLSRAFFHDGEGPEAYNIGGKTIVGQPWLGKPSLPSIQKHFSRP